MTLFRLKNQSITYTTLQWHLLYTDVSTELSGRRVYTTLTWILNLRIIIVHEVLVNVRFYRLSWRCQSFTEQVEWNVHQCKSGGILCPIGVRFFWFIIAIKQLIAFYSRSQVDFTQRNGVSFVLNPFILLTLMRCLCALEKPCLAKFSLPLAAIVEL